MLWMRDGGGGEMRCEIGFGRGWRVEEGSRRAVTDWI